MFKNTKRVLAIMLAMAVIAMSMFTGVVVSATETGTIDLLEFGKNGENLPGSTSQWYDTNVADNGETGDSWENAIIIDSAEEFVYLCKASGNDTAGKYYKVADGIKGFDLSKGDIDYNGTLADNIDKIKAGGKNHAGGTPGFQGNFDGNGATVYGAWSNHNQVSNYAGLFTCTKGDVTIKNIHVNKAHFTAKNAAGGIVGYHEATKTAAQAKTETESSGELVLPVVGTLTIENCSVTDSYIEVQGTGYGHGAGAILGFENNSWSDSNITYGLSYVDASKIIVVSGKDCYDVDGDGKNSYYNGAHTISNCYVNLDESNFVSKAEDGTTETNERACHGGVVGVSGSNALQVSNCVVIGIKPYATSESTSNDVQHSGLASHFKNVYTTSDVEISDVTIGGTLPAQNFKSVFPLADDQLKGAAALENMNLDWSVWMADSEGYPELRNMHKDVAFEDNGDGTHGEVCACGFGGVSSSHIWVNKVCACGAELDCSGRDTIYWDGTVATGIATGSGAEDDPYIINTAAEFAWLVKNADVDGTATTSHDSTGKYYKIADNIGTIVLQPQDLAAEVLALNSAEETRDFFESDEYVFAAWPNVGWEQSSFAGNFDGNGATVYGLYQVSSNNAGLFSTVEGGAIIKNIAIKNSYITSTAEKYQVGAIAPVSSSKNYGAEVNGIVWFENITVANNYLYNTSEQNDRSGVLAGALSDVLYADNILVYDNIALDGLGRNMPLVNAANNSVAYDESVIPEGLEVKTGEAEIGTLFYNMVRNSVIMGTEPYDTTQNVGSRFNDAGCYENVYTDADVTAFFNKIGSDQIKKVTVGELATLSLSDVWYNTATYPELKVFHDADLPILPNNDGTHGSVCSCGAKFLSPCTFVDGKCSVCEAGLTCASKRTIYWNGSVATGFADTSAGTKDDPIIISSAEELAYLVSCKADVTMDKYFEMADDIGTIVLQAQDLASEIIALDSAAAVQAYFENDEYIFTEWVEKGWEQSCFAGNFNGNGVKIYGLYIVTDYNAGLFSTVDAGASIHNVAVLNSYMYSTAHFDENKQQWANYQVGAIAAVASNGVYGTGEAGVIWFEGCIVGNCYMRNDAADAGRSGVLFGAASSDAVTIDNCLVYGNDAKHNESSVDMPLINLTSNSIIVPARVPAELDAKIQENANANGDSMYYNAVRNTITFGTDIMNTNTAYGYRRNDPACYENNFTDGASGTVAFTQGEWTYEDTQIKAVTLDDINDNDLGDVWAKTNSYPELRAFHVSEIVDNGDGTHSASCACGVINENAEAHNYEGGKCTICGAKDTVTINYGDVNDDGKINGRDYGLLMQHINGWVVTINEANADVNGDGKINGRDYGLLMQHINGWEVTFGPKS